MEKNKRFKKTTADVYNEESNYRFFHDPDKKNNLITKIINKEMDYVFKCINVEDLRRRSALALDIGCSGGRYTFKLVSNGIKTIGIDIAFQALKYAYKNKKHPDNPNFIGASVTHLPFQDNSFDAIICMELLHHLDDKHLEFAFVELRRIIKPDGIIVFDLKNTLNPVMYLTYRRLMNNKFKGTSHLMLTRTPFKYDKLIKQSKLKIMRKIPLYAPISLVAPIIIYKIKK